MQRMELAVAIWLALGLVAGGCLGGWAIEDSPTDADLYAVFGVPGGNVFAVGAGGTVLQRRSSGWRDLDSGTEEDLRGVWGTGDEHVVVVGRSCTALEYNGEVQTPPDGGEQPPDLRALEVEGCPDFRDIDGFGPAAAAAVGGSRIYWYDGQQFTRGGWRAGNLQGVSTPAQDDYYLSGEAGVFRWYDGESWQGREIGICPVDLVEDRCPMELMLPILWDVWVGESGEGALVGTYGGMWRIPPPEEGNWEPLDTGLDGQLRAVHGRDADEIWAVGDHGIVLRQRGEEIRRHDIGTHEDLHGVWVSASGKHVYAVGANGTIGHLVE